MDFGNAQVHFRKNIFCKFLKKKIRFGAILNVNQEYDVDFSYNFFLSLLDNENKSLRFL